MPGREMTALEKIARGAGGDRPLGLNPTAAPNATSLMERVQRLETVQARFQEEIIAALKELAQKVEHHNSTLYGG